MPTSEDKIKNLRALLEQVVSIANKAVSVASEIEIPTTRKSDADYFIPTLAANLDNEKLTDADFRQFVRNSLCGLKL